MSTTRTVARVRLPFILAALIAVAGCSQQSGDAAASDQSAAPQDPVMARGESVYYANCVACHLPAGTGLEGAFPPLAGSDYLEGDRSRVIATILYGRQGPITVNGVEYNGVMPKFAHLNDAEVAAVVTYIFQSWGNDLPAMGPEEVAAVRAAPR
ncbi:MAG: cytochrome c [Woeseiaceae bacterium]|nr:cytochrome c [Woeseiaceae bacterium]